MVRSLYGSGVTSLLWSLALLCAFSTGAAPVAHWAFDVVEGGVRDKSGECHGRLEGEALSDQVRPGVFGEAQRFDAGRTRVRVPHNPAVSLHRDFTIEYVIKPSRTDGFRTILWKGDRTVTPQSISYYVDLRDGRPELKMKDAEGRWVVYSIPTALSAGEWHHVVIAFDRGTVEIHADGVRGKVSMSENGKLFGELLENRCDLVLGDGANPSGSAYSFCGLIDEILFYKGRQVEMLEGDYSGRWKRLLAKVRDREKAFELAAEQRRIVAKRVMEEDYDTLVNAQAVEPGAPFVATVLPTSERLNGSPDFFRQIRRFTRTAAISAARGEYEGFQVILLGRRGVDGVTASVSVTDLVREDGKERISSTAVTWGEVERVTTEEPDLPVSFVGAIPDVINETAEGVSVPGRDFAGIFCRIWTGDAQPGCYRGKLTLSAGESRETIDIVLTVYDFALPTRGSLRTAFCFFEHYYRKWYGYKTLTDQQQESIYEFLLSYRLSPCNIYSGTAPFPELRFLEKYRDRINFFTIGRIKGKSEEEIRESVTERTALLRKIRELGLEEYMYFYSFDELSMNMKHLPMAKKITTALQRGWPGLKMMQTSFPIPALQPYFNAWAPLFHEFGKAEGIEMIESMRQRGDRIWWYAADSPKHPCPNFFLDYPVFDCRIIGTLSYLQKVEGVLYWCINREWQTNLDIRERWPEAEWRSHIFHIYTGKRKYKNGMGNLIYPGNDGALWPSLRLENLRDGLEDYEYLCALGTAVKRLEADDSPAAGALLPEARGLLAPPATVATGIRDWSSDPELLLQYRDRVGRMLGKIAAAPPPPR